MGAGDLGGDIEPEAQALLPGAPGAAEERLEEAIDGAGRDRLALVLDRQREDVAVARGADPHRRVRRAMRQRVAEEIREQLSDAGAVAFDRLVDDERGLDRPLRPGGPQLGGDLLRPRPQARRAVETEPKAAAKAPAGKIEHVV